MSFFSWFKERSGCDLNDEQKQAIEYVTGSLLVVAGAGTGKTMMITAKAAYLLNEKKIAPDRLLMLTFSRQAAAHMKDELEKVTPNANGVVSSTFHAFCLDFLQQRARKTRVGENVGILDELDAAVMLHRELELPPERAKHYISTIERAKDLGFTRSRYAEHVQKFEKQVKDLALNSDNLELQVENARLRVNTIHLELLTKQTKEEKKGLNAFLDAFDEWKEYCDFLVAWDKYEELKSKKFMLDYADLNKRVLDYAAEIGDDEISELFDYVIVDEFQDTNQQQFQLLKLLTAKHGNITVVGDPNQAIYAFRGAYANNLDAFEKEFTAKRLPLKLNYRSTNTILRTAHRLAKNNYDDPTKAVLLQAASGEDGAKVRVIRTLDQKEQARKLVEEIEALHGNGVPYQEIAILFRAHSSTPQIQASLDRRGLPYQFISGSGFLRRPEVRTALAYLYVAANLEKRRFGADPLWWRLLHYKYGLTNQDSHILAKAADRGSIQDVLLAKSLPEGLSEDGKSKISTLLTKIEGLRKNKAKPLPDLLLDVYEAAGISRWFSYEATSENRLSLLNLRYLHDLSLKFQEVHGGELTDFIDYLEILGEMGEDLEAQKIADVDGIVLMTCHAAKGLEFNHVFIVDLVKDKFPLTRGGAEPIIPDEFDERYAKFFAELEKKEAEKKTKELKKIEKNKEERRLAYVAFTRARSQLNLCLAKTYGESQRDQSVFLTETGFTPTECDKDLELIEDSEVKAQEIVSDTDLDRKKIEIKKILLATIDADPVEAFHNFLLYERLSGHELPVKEAEVKRTETEAQKILESTAAGCPTGLKFNPQAVRFSITSLNAYELCPKQYELSQLLHMPSRFDDEEGEGARGKGTFVHEVLEVAVKQKVSERKQLDEIAEHLKEKRDYHNVDLNECKLLFDVFWARNAAKLQNTIMAEEKFNFELDGLQFTGKIDRVDVVDPKTKSIEIIDYKTGSEPTKQERARQLLTYALAFELDPKLNDLGYAPTFLTLDMLKQDKPLIFKLENGNMEAVGSRCDPANIEETKTELLTLAKNAARDYEKGYATTEDDATCKRCAYRLYCPKWG